MKNLYFKFFVDSIAINLISIFGLKNIKIDKKNKIKKVCLIEIQFHNVLLMVLYYYFGKILSKKFKIIYFYYSKFNYENKNIFFNFIYFFYFKKLKKIISSEIINFYNKPLSKDYLDARKLFNKIKNRKKLANLEYKNYKIGRFIYQSYCRELMKESVDISDLRLINYIAEAIKLINEQEKFHNKYLVDNIFISHTIFLRYGLICSVAKKKRVKIKLLYLTNAQGLLKQLKLLNVNNELIQQERYWNFRKEFSKLSNTEKQKAYALSKKDLESRINLNSISYKLMVRNSPYNKENVLNLTSNRPKIIILPSCFFDVVNFFRFKLFEDNYTWLVTLLEYAKKTQFDWYLKPHPDGFHQNYKIIKLLKEKYPFLKVLPSNTSNLTFKKNKFSSMFTFHGSAIHEFAFMGIPSVCVSDNIHINYKFGKPILKLKDFKKAVLNADKVKKNIILKDVYELNYMFNFDKSSDLSKVTFLKRSESTKMSCYDLSNNYLYVFKKVFYLDKLINQQRLLKISKLLS